MSMVFGLDLHRQQITFDGLDVESGQVWKGRVWQPDRERFRRWLERDVADRANGQPVALAVEGCTGWRYVVEEITAAGLEAHLAEPADTQAARGRNGGRRRIVPTRRCCASCCSVAICPSRGSRRQRCWSGANGCGSTSRWSINARCGPSGSMPSCSSTVCRSPRVGSGRRRLGPSWPTTPG